MAGHAVACMASSTVRHVPTCRAHHKSSPRSSGAGHSLLARAPIRSPFLSGTRIQHKALAQPLSATTGGALAAQANLFSRLFRVIRSYTNSFVSGAEDPEKMLDQTVNEMQADVIKMRQASAQVLASQKQMETKYRQAKQTADEWYRRAQLAVEKGDDELAREALKRKKSFEDNAKVLKVQLDSQQKAVDQLVGNTKLLESKLSEAKGKKETLKARAKSAQSSKAINEMLQGLNTSNAMVAFEKMEEKVMALESESQATLQLAATNDELESKFALLEGDDVDSELSEMKKGMLSGRRQPVSSLPEGRAEGRPRIRDAIDFELEDLRRKARE